MSVDSTLYFPYPKAVNAEMVVKYSRRLCGSQLLSLRFLSCPSPAPPLYFCAACDAPATPPPSRKRHRSEDGPSSSEEPAAARSRVDPQGGPRAAGAGVAAATKLEFTDRESEVKLEEQGKPSSSEEPGAAGSRVNPQGESEAARAGAGVEAAKPEVSEVKQEEHDKDGTSRNLAASEGWEGPSAAALVKMEPPHTAG